MSFPTSHPSSGSTPQPSRHGVGVPPRALPGHPDEGDHQLEKLQFALAIALTRGDIHRSSQLRQEIAELGDRREEPGT